ncbi:MAG: ABC transporter substrate-binding protein [Gammaproteobacteria bacterium]|nr:ABC transporter substrate-binding protein [Gammaproteobacteria bacterium]MBU1625695.1 ABC transporter substrate-binding protein [Gammaproteobacteria bacterium]MBU1980955.1 ABC transporter substrate-binding protein [Gammaproteobacteria bacterium]
MKSLQKRLSCSCIFLRALVLLPLLTACDNPHEQPLGIASSPWPGYEPLYLAKEIGYLPQEKAKLFELPSSDITLEAFRNHSADMATLTLDEALDLMDSGVKLRILMALDISNGADAVMVKPHIKKLSDLKGKRIAILNIPLGVYMLSRTLDAAGLSREDVTVIPSAESKHEEMYRLGKADAFITFDPFKTALAKQGAQVLFDSSMIPNEIFDLMLVREEVFQARREDVCHVARQWGRTLEYMRQEPDAAAESIAKRLGVTPQEYLAMVQGIKTPTLQENLALLGGNAPGILNAAKRLNTLMRNEGQLDHEIDINTALVPDLHTCVTD